MKSKSPRVFRSSRNNAVWESTWMYVLVGALILVSGIVFFMWKPLEFFENAETKAPNYPVNVVQPELAYFYMKTCPYCQEFSPIWDDAENKIKSSGIAIKMNKYDIQDDAEGSKKGGQFNIKAAPTVKYIDGYQVTEYNGPHTADALLSFVKSKAVAPSST